MNIQDLFFYPFYIFFFSFLELLSYVSVLTEYIFSWTPQFDLIWCKLNLDDLEKYQKALPSYILTDLGHVILGGRIYR
jgi:hypothetical protein